MSNETGALDTLQLDAYQREKIQGAINESLVAEDVENG